MDEHVKKRDLSTMPLPGDEPIKVREEAGTGLASDTLNTAVARIMRGWDYWQENHRLAREDVEFAYRDQWDGINRGNRPKLTFNILTKFINNIMGAARRTKYSVHVIQTAGLTHPTSLFEGGGTTYSRAEIMEGIIRDIEVRSNAKDIYCRALQHALEGGFGWMMVKPAKMMDDPERMELKIRLVKDRWSILVDPHAEADDLCDAQWCCESTCINEDEYKARYPGMVPSGIGDWLGDSAWPSGYRQWWYSNKTVRVVDYWWKEPMERTCLRLEHAAEEPLTLWEDEAKPILDELAELGYRRVEGRRGRFKVKSYKVRYMRHTANEILEGPFDWPSMELPVIPVFGREVNMDNYSVYLSLIRFARDPQRTYNYWMTALTERVALAPRAPWLITPDQVQGHETEWRDQHQNNTAVLLYNHKEGQPPPERILPPQMPVAEMQIVNMARSGMMDTIGMYEASLGMRSNEVSGVAIENRQRESDASTYEFTDKLGSSVARVGQVLCDMIPRVYRQDQVVRLIMPDESSARAHLNHEIVDSETGRTFRIGSLDLGRYTTRVESGPQSTTQRQEFVRMMMELGRSNPEVFTGFYDLILQASDFPLRDELVRRAKLMLPRHLLRPEEQQQMPEPPPTPEQQAEMAKAEAAVATAQASVQTKEIEKSIREVELKKSKVDLEAATVKAAAAGAETPENKGESGDDADFERRVNKVIAKNRAKG